MTDQKETPETNALTAQLPRLLYTKEDVAYMLGVSVGTIENMLRYEATPRHYITGKVRFTTEDVDGIVSLWVSDQRKQNEQGRKLV